MDVDRAQQAREYARREIMRAGFRAVAILVAFFALPFDRNWVLAAVLLVLMLVGLFPFVVRRFQRVLRSEHPIGDAISALLMTLVTLIVAFAGCYYILAKRDPGSMQGMATKIDAIYFEMTILSTVGFGDITATGQGARVLVTLNMLMGAVFLGTSLRLLTYTIQRQGLPGPGDGPSFTPPG